MRKLLILDDGHGLGTAGKRTPALPNGRVMLENEFNSVVINYIAALFANMPDYDIVYTAAEKLDVDLNSRIKRANDYFEQYKTTHDIILISVHANALNGDWGSQNGIETYHYINNETDRAAAQIIHDNLIAAAGLKDRGVKAGNFAILREVKAVSVLCECGFMDNKIEAALLQNDKYRYNCAWGIKEGILKYFTGKEEENAGVIFSATINKTFQLSGAVDRLYIKKVDKSNTAILEKNCINGVFFWRDTKGNTYPTSILYADGQAYKSQANHLPRPQSVFIIYKNGAVEMKRIYNLDNTAEINRNDIKIAIGGVGLINKFDKNFVYNPAAEGFDGVFSDVLIKRNKTVIAYNKKKNKIFLLVRPQIAHQALNYDLLELCKDCDYDIALSLDGGGSSFMNTEAGTILRGDGRKIFNIVGFN